ncbi:hypothetical protein [Deinococcus arcticus]|uniref:Uncharacterized protein n=1 Tax=Deinococcus arcticus TaxID=2136176 RepID=A0A2T3W4T4_9DEIO|nr:hypothetical protein [Deinococcus arcticus]PTA66804.1 hypothetical protein C8263_15800 [Deinococcus arcticus]
MTDFLSETGLSNDFAEIRIRASWMKSKPDLFTYGGQRIHIFPYQKGQFVVIEKSKSLQMQLIEIFEHAIFNSDQNPCQLAFAQDTGGLLKTCELPSDILINAVDVRLVFSLNKRTEFGQRGELLAIITGPCDWYIEPLKNLKESHP